MPTKKIKLIMTLFVRDEEDLIEDNICFHLNFGVDHIIVTDNGSIDKTKQILSKYKKLGLITVFNAPKYNYAQAKWVSFMAKYAVKKLKATHLFHCDADEFWYPDKGNLKTKLPNQNEVYNVSLINYIPPLINKKSFKYKNFRYAVLNPIDEPISLSELRSSKILIYKYPKKIITTNKFTEITIGNHSINTKENYKLINSKDIFIHHFSIRNYNHFIKRVIRSGTAMVNSGINDPRTNWHIRSWYKKYLNRNLSHEYDLISLKNKKTLNKYISQKIVKKTKVPKKIRYAKLLFYIKHILNK